MKDRIIEGYLKDFAEAHDLKDVDEPKLFEHFINHCIVSREHPENFDFETVTVGGLGEIGLDGIAILVNDHLVSSKDEIEFFSKKLRRLDVRFLFIQAKTGERFDMGEIGNFLFGVRSFFAQDGSVHVNDQIARLRQMKEFIYDSSIDMDHNPSCELYYATTGRWTDDAILLERIQAETSALRQTVLFSDVVFKPLDGEAVKTLYRELRHKVTREIVFEKHTILPTIKDVDEAYIGILPCSEYVKLISDNEGKLQRSVFYDNVRDFQGNNPVNQEIEETLKDSTENDKFVLLNNGITIVAGSLNKVGTRFRLKDFQIVNGCQTSHILFRNLPVLQNVCVPVKIIVTTDTDVTSAITKGTNRQTQVNIEAFESLNPFQKELEEFYSTFGKDKVPRLYYERRSRQYENLPIQQNHIITIPAQVKCFVGMFLNEPHSTHRYYGELLDANRSRMFLPNHSPFPYFLSGYALSVLHSLFSRALLSQTPRKFRYHMLMLFRVMFEPTPIPYLNDKRRMDAYCLHLLMLLGDETTARRSFSQCAELLNSVLKASPSKGRESDRLRAFTAELIAATSAKVSGATPGAVERKRGRVKDFSAIRGFGFIAVDNGEVFVHYTGIKGAGYRSLSKGQIVEFVISEGRKGPEAREVEVVADKAQSA